MTKTIFRVEKDKNYTTINNTSVQDKRLSWKAKGIHLFMLTRPDDWIFYNEELQQWAKDGRDSFLSGLKELQQHGYVKKIRERNEDGTFDYITVIYEVPQPDYPSTGKPLTEEPLTDYPLTENPQLLSTNTLNTNKPNTNKQNKEERASSPSPLVDMNFLKIKQHYEQQVIYQPANFQQCKHLAEILDNHQDTALIIEAMNISVQRGKPHLPYINGILNTWRSDNITNQQQLQGVKRRGAAKQPIRDDQATQSAIRATNERRARLAGF